MQPEIGISESLHPEHEGFFGIIKMRYSDFIVREVDPTGAVLSMVRPDTIFLRFAAQISHDSPSTPASEFPCADLASLLSELYSTDDIPDMVTWIEDQTRAIKELFIIDNQDRVVVLPPIKDKQARTRLHDFFKKPSITLNGTNIYAFHTVTQPQDNTILISFCKASQHSRKRGRSGDLEFPNFLQLYLLKRNKDTIEAIQRAATFIGVPDRHISFAGTKDRRAITLQRISIKDPISCFARNIDIPKITEPGHMWYLIQQRLIQINQGLERHGITLGFPEETMTEKGSASLCLDHALGLGELAGNHFDIIIRHIRPLSPSHVDWKQSCDSALESLSTDGFINYFGSQRFGHSDNVPTWKIGLAFIKKDWNSVINLILCPRGDNIQNDDVEPSRRIFWHEGDAYRALMRLPKKWAAERAILSYYHKHPEHLSYDNGNISLLSPLSAIESIPHELRLLYLHSLQSYIWNHVASARMRMVDQQSRSSCISGDLILQDQEYIIYHANGDHLSIHDAFLPLPGSTIQIYPHRDLYDQIIKTELGLNGLDAFSAANQTGKYALRGDYRSFVVRPQNMSWRWIFYSGNQNIDLQDTDGCQIRIFDKDTGQIPCLQLSFRLPPSSYATMLLEEFLKCDTSSENQKTLESSADSISES